MTSLTRVLPVAHGVAWRTVKNALTNPSILLPTFMFPLFFLIAFALAILAVIVASRALEQRLDR